MTVLTAGEQVVGVASMDVELKFLLEEKKISTDVIAFFGHLGLFDVTTVAHIEESEGKCREMLESEFGLKASEEMASRVQTSCLIDAWHAVRERNTARNADATAARIEGRSRELLPHIFVSVRRQ